MSLRTIEIVIDTTPNALGDLVTSKAWAAANYFPICDGQQHILVWNVLAHLPEVKQEWVRDAFEFFNNWRLMAKIGKQSKLGMRPSYEFPTSK